MNYTGSSRTLFEQQNQKLCYEVLKEKIVKKEPLSVELIKEIHKILTSGTYDERRYIINKERPGEFKKHDCVTGVHEVGSSAENVENDLTELIAEVNAYDGKDEDKRIYYECLQKYDEAEELNPLYEFLKYETEKTWGKALALADGRKLERKGLSDFTQSM